MMNDKIKALTMIYFLLILTLVGLVLATPRFANERIFTWMDDTIAETITLLGIIATGFAIRFFYHRELKRSQRDIKELINHIGNINVQVQEIKYFFNDVRKYPENKSDLKYLFNILSDRILAIVNVEWILFRIIDVGSNNTLSEHMQCRKGKGNKNCEISNKEIMRDKVENGYKVIKTNQENFNVRAFCILPENNLSEHQKIFVRRITNDLEMLYIIFSSQYYRNTRS
jgi:hypothetical protein